MKLGTLFLWVALLAALTLSGVAGCSESNTPTGPNPPAQDPGDTPAGYGKLPGDRTLGPSDSPDLG